MNKDVFVVYDRAEEEYQLVIKECILEDFETFQCLGNLRLAEETVGPSWGYDIENSSSLGMALLKAGLDPDDYRRRDLDSKPSEDCLNTVRNLLSSNENVVDNNARYTFM